MEKELYKAHPAMFRNHPLLFILCVILVAAAGLGLIILLIWWFKVLGTTLIITNRRTILQKGIFSRQTNELFHSDIRNIKVWQSFQDRIFDVGRIGISSAGQAGIEIDVSGIPNPYKVRDLIETHRERASSLGD